MTDARTAAPLTARYAQELDAIREQGLFKSERIITSPQSAEITLDDGRQVLNFCANNYLGLADHPDLIQAAKDALDSHGFGMASVRFICGTQDLHKQLEAQIAGFFGKDDTILYAACFDANGGLFEPLLGENDAIISDALNHASIIDGVRLCKARRYRYANCDMADLEAQLKQAKADGAQTILITTDGCSRWTASSPRWTRSPRWPEVRCAGAHRRMPRHRLSRRYRPWLGRGQGRAGEDRHHHRHPGQGDGRRVGRFHHRQAPK
jgi:7-keto-8-aminopelargonate synthetase and related enzymes